MKRFLLFCCAVLLFAVFSFGQVSPADKIIGVYLTAKKTSQVRIFQATDNKYYGKVAWIVKKDAANRDSLNPDPKLQNQKVWGLIILNSLTYNQKSKQWENGTIYDPDNGKTYTCYLWFDEKDPKLLHLKGYILGMRFIGRSSDWIREEKLREN